MYRIVPALVLLVAALAHADSAPPAPEWLVAPHDPELAPLRRPSYFEQHAARVERHLLKFDHGYTLERMRERDELERYGATPGTPVSAARGAAIFSATVVATAHTPAAFAFAFDRLLHVGPAIFDAGGMGAGVGGHW